MNEDRIVTSYCWINNSSRTLHKKSLCWISINFKYRNNFIFTFQDNLYFNWCMACNCFETRLISIRLAWSNQQIIPVVMSVGNNNKSSQLYYDFDFDNGVIIATFFSPLCCVLRATTTSSPLGCWRHRQNRRTTDVLRSFLLLLLLARQCRGDLSFTEFRMKSIAFILR